MPGQDNPEYPDVQEVSDDVLALAIVTGESLLRSSTHWSSPARRDECAARVEVLREEWDRRRETPARS